MPTIYDNIDEKLLDGLKNALTVAERGDFCVGYFNLRGWKCIAKEVDTLPKQEGISPCRLIVGMNIDVNRTVRRYYNHESKDTSSKVVFDRKKQFALSLARQLTFGTPTANDQVGLKQLATQLRKQQLQVKFFGRYPLHAKLYLAHRDDKINPIIGYVGSSNLTLAGLEKQGELNVDVLDKDAAEKLAKWFEERWDDKWCLDITNDLADIIESSWAGGPIDPYYIYIKTAYELSKEAIEGAREFKVPSDFDKVMLEFQKQAVSLAAERLSRHHGVIIGDVVGLGKTLVASAVAKTFQQDHGDNVLVICPPKLEKMWNDYLHKYTIAGETLSTGKTHRLSDMRRFRLVVIDESHNLRNRDSKRYAHIHDYIRENESRVILLTATPYNKQFTDIGNQLRLFVEADADLGIRPEGYIDSLNGINFFKEKHTNTLATSLAAFEHSESADDWRELMRMYMVRRTRSHIKENYAEYDEDRKQHYLLFDNGERFYFPHRTPKCAKFSLDESDGKDQYALLYSESVVEIVSGLKLPRYGIGEYLLSKYQADSLPDELDEEKQKIIKNLSRAGNRLVGFAKSGLFKRLESSGPAFLLSVKRHIVRNAVYLSALEQDGAFPIGDIFSELTDETVEEREPDLLNQEMLEKNSIEFFLEAGRNVYKKLSDKGREWYRKFNWIETNFFKDPLRDALRHDCEALLEILNKIPQWDVDADRKLAELARLCKEEHLHDKLLIFTQFKDTADYLHRELKKQKVDGLAMVFGGMDDISNYVKRFSPTSNDEQSGRIDELRVLITTDTLSEGQNLQDAHIVVNFDLPWAIIRLIQRVGRVDRIGQKAKEILCYCFLPEDDIEKVIKLRERLDQRMRQAAEVVGTDESFFEGDTINLEHVYNQTISLEEQEDETDLISRAYDIWRQAIKDNPKLEKKIKELPHVVYSAKHADDQKDGAIAYIKTSNNQHLLLQLNQTGEVVSQSQSKILGYLACEPNEPLAPPAQNHHELVDAAISHIKQGQAEFGGQLGGTRSIRNKLYSKLNFIKEQIEGTLFESPTLKAVIQQIHDHPLKETARDRLARQLRTHISDEDLVRMAENFYDADDLCATPKEGEPIESSIICSMGLIK
ncbi:helicase-related protein [Candidatus Spongiihabitans sp.]|uniref:helicase-related protein n=1 Tax=Candidatus Spongiihabitans sp. TaxID=3101308 RepID=UPI003C7EA3C6